MAAEVCEENSMEGKFGIVEFKGVSDCYPFFSPPSRIAISSFDYMVSQFSFELGILCQAVVRERGCNSGFQVGAAHGRS